MGLEANLTLPTCLSYLTLLLPREGIGIFYGLTQLPTGIVKTTAYQALVVGRDVVITSILPLHFATQRCRNSGSV